MNTTLGQFRADVIVRELGHRDVELVAHITPECTQHLVVELARLVGSHQARSLLESLGGHLVGLLATHSGNIGIVDGTLTEDDKQRDEHQHQSGHGDPIGRRAEEELAHGVLLGIARLDITDILVEFLQAILTGEIADRRSARTLGHIEMEGLGLNRFVALGGGIEIGKLYRRDIVLALVTRHDEEVVDLRTLEARRGQLGLVGNLGLVLIEILWQIDDGLLDELEVTRTANDDTQGDGVVGLSLGLVELGRDVELTYSTREGSRALWQRVYLNLDAGSLDLLLNLYIARTAVEEGLERVDITILLNHNTLEGDRRYLQLAGGLWEHDILAPSAGAVWAAIHILDRERLLLRQVYLLRVEALKIGHIATKLRQLHKGIYLISKEYRLLFEHALLVGTHLDEEVAARDTATHLANLLALVVVIRTRVGTSRTYHLDGERFRSNLLTIYYNVGRRNGIRATLSGSNDISIGDRRRLTGVAVNHLIA